MSNNQSSNTKNNSKECQKTEIAELFDISKTKLPRKTREIFQTLKSQNMNIDIDNFSLKLNKACYFEERQNKFLFSKKTKGNKGEIFSLKADFKKIDFRKICQEQTYCAEKLLGKNNVRKLSRLLDARMVLGLGNASVYETSMTLHHVYGCPYIPAQAVKGVLRHFFLEKHNITENQLKERSEYADYKTIFGTEEKRGEVVFFDAFPISAEKLKLITDIMTPHYSGYYGDKEGEKAPSDTENPTPIPFLTVDKETKFQFLIGCRNKKLLDDTETLLKEAFNNVGFGAKTALGYGFFKGSKEE